MKKKCLIVLLLIVILLSIVACNSEQPDSTNQGESRTEETGISDTIDPENGADDANSAHSDELAGLYNSTEGNNQSDENSDMNQTQTGEESDEDSAAMVFNQDDRIYYSPFTGTAVREMYLHKAVMAVVENSPAARPQSGLDEASIVYEFLVEGGITRFLALYWGEIPEKIGPIRSARPYMINVADEYNALLLHAGASPQGFEMLAEGSVAHLDQIYRSRYYWRGSDRRPPHNLYTGEKRIEDYLNRLIGQEYQQRFSFQQLSVIKPEDQAADIIRIPFWGGTMVTYKYNSRENKYYRYYGAIDIPHLLDNNKQITTDNVIIQYTRTRQIDDVGRLEIDLQGRGNSIVFSDGIMIEGFWEKSDEGFTKYYNNLGERIKLNPGQTWIEIVPSSIRVEYFDTSILNEQRDLDQIENDIIDDEENNENNENNDYRNSVGDEEGNNDNSIEDERDSKINSVGEEEDINDNSIEDNYEDRNDFSDEVNSPERNENSN